MEHNTDLTKLENSSLDEFIDQVEELLNDPNNMEEIPPYRLDYLHRMFKPDGSGVDKSQISDGCCNINVDLIESLEKEFREIDKILNEHQAKCNYLVYLLQKYESIKDEYFMVWNEKKNEVERSLGFHEPTRSGPVTVEEEHDDW